MVLSLWFLGTFQVMLDDEPASFATDRARALLALLAVEADRPHRREVLADMLWPDRPEAAARRNLSQTLARLRRAIDDYHADPPHLSITNKTIQFNASAAELDVTRFEALIQACLRHAHPSLDSCSSCAGRLDQAAQAYRGDFLEGLFLSNSQGFEEWALFKREQLHREALEALQALTRYYERQGVASQVARYAHRQLALEPWLEEAHRQVMRALWLNGQRGDALAQYRACRRVLDKELGVEPEVETTALFERIRDGEAAPLVPGSLAAGAWAEAKPAGTFVGRVRQLEHLDGYLERAIAGKGQVVLITGETGAGKSALAQEFARRAQERHSDLIVAVGKCNAQTGLGDPYLPFREVLGLLTGEVEAAWAEGTISGQSAARLAALGPISGAALAELGPDLLGRFVSDTHLPGPYGGAVFLAPELAQENEALSQPGQATDRLPQRNLHQQYTAVLQALAAHQPLLLLLHGLQWADLSSASLLFHLSRHLNSSRILLVVTYRPEDVAMGWQDGSRPLRELIGELKRDLGDIQIDLDQVTRQERRRFVDALLDTEPNRLGEEFRQDLFEHTEGHALFTVELLKEMQECGDLQQDADGRWVEGPTLNWDRLPSRVEGVIERRFGRLATHLRQGLRVASVEGEEFTAEVVARVQGLDSESFIRDLSAKAVRQHRLLAPPSIRWLDSQHLARYRFRHTLFQKYLYQTLDEAERVVLHREVARTLEALYGDQSEQIAAQLAHHFEAAGNAVKAAEYLGLAAKKARQLSS
jgi:DNA-binding SARP family transcriptional activator/energy-coupling factor transporter ATP-binding protein EcfA2